MPALRRLPVSLRNIGPALSTTLAGVVLANNSPVRRMVHVYKNNDTAPLASLWSDPADGSWQVTVPGGGNDRFRVVVVGAPGENSQIFEHLQAP